MNQAFTPNDYYAFDPTISTIYDESNKKHQKENQSTYPTYRNLNIDILSPKIQPQEYKSLRISHNSRRSTNNSSIFKRSDEDKVGKASINPKDQQTSQINLQNPLTMFSPDGMKYDYDALFKKNSPSLNTNNKYHPNVFSGYKEEPLITLDSNAKNPGSYFGSPFDFKNENPRFTNTITSNDNNNPLMSSIPKFGKLSEFEFNQLLSPIPNNAFNKFTNNNNMDLKYSKNPFNEPNRGYNHIISTPSNAISNKVEPIIGQSIQSIIADEEKKLHATNQNEKFDTDKFLMNLPNAQKEIKSFLPNNLYPTNIYNNDLNATNLILEQNQPYEKVKTLSNRQEQTIFIQNHDTHMVTLPNKNEKEDKFEIISIDENIALGMLSTKSSMQQNYNKAISQTQIPNKDIYLEKSIPINKPLSPKTSTFIPNIIINDNQDTDQIRINENPNQISSKKANQTPLISPKVNSNDLLYPKSIDQCLLNSKNLHSNTRENSISIRSSSAHQPDEGMIIRKTVKSSYNTLNNSGTMRVKYTIENPVSTDILTDLQIQNNNKLPRVEDQLSSSPINALRQEIESQNMSIKRIIIETEISGDQIDDPLLGFMITPNRNASQYNKYSRKKINEISMNIHQDDNNDNMSQTIQSVENKNCKNLLYPSIQNEISMTKNDNDLMNIDANSNIENDRNKNKNDKVIVENKVIIKGVTEQDQDNDENISIDQNVEESKTSDTLSAKLDNVSSSKINSLAGKRDNNLSAKSDILSEKTETLSVKGKSLSIKSNNLLMNTDILSPQKILNGPNTKIKESSDNMAPINHDENSKIHESIDIRHNIKDIGDDSNHDKQDSKLNLSEQENKIIDNKKKNVSNKLNHAYHKKLEKTQEQINSPHSSTNIKEAKEVKESRKPKEEKKVKESIESKEVKEIKEFNEPKETKEVKEAEEVKEEKEPKKVKKTESSIIGKESSLKPDVINNKINEDSHKIIEEDKSQLKDSPEKQIANQKSQSPNKEAAKSLITNPKHKKSLFFIKTFIFSLVILLLSALLYQVYDGNSMHEYSMKILLTNKSLPQCNLNKGLLK